MSNRFSVLRPKRSKIKVTRDENVKIEIHETENALVILDVSLDRWHHGTLL